MGVVSAAPHSSNQEVCYGKTRSVLVSDLGDFAEFVFCLRIASCAWAFLRVLFHWFQQRKSRELGVRFAYVGQVLRGIVSSKNLDVKEGVDHV